MIRIFEFSSTKIMLEFQSKYIAKGDTYETVLRQEAIKKKMKNLLANAVINNTMTVEKAALKKRLIKLDEIRKIAVEKKIEFEENLIEKTDKKKLKHSITTKFLVLLRKLTQDHQHNHKLESR